MIDRVHNINEPLMVFLRFSGTAMAGEDYLALPDHVLFPAGRSQVVIWPEAVDDNIVEGDETLILEVVPPPPGTETEFPTTYVFGPPASGIISDNESTNFPPHLEIVKPQYQQLLEQGSDIEVKVIARDRNGYIPKVQLVNANINGNPVLATSEKTFDTPPVPGTPIEHTLVWSNPALSNGLPRVFYLRVIGFDMADNIITSNLTTVVVGPNPDRVTLGLSSFWRGTETSERLTNGLPAGTSFYLSRVFGPTNQAVHYLLTFEGTAANGIDFQPVSLSGVLEAGVGFTNIAVTPIPDNLVEGTETFRVKLVDPQCWTTTSTNDPGDPGCYMVGTNSEIAFTIYDAPPTNIASVGLSVEVQDDEALEVPVNGVTDTAKFRVRRVSGPIDRAVRFEIATSGEAWNGVDYERLDTIITMASNQSYVDIVIRPMVDETPEGDEAVILTLVDYNCGVPSRAPGLAVAGSLPDCYDVVGSNVAQAIIIDNHDGFPPRAMITNPADGTVIEEGEQVVVEAEAVDFEGMLHSVGLQMDGESVRSINPAVPGTGTNMIYTGQVQYSFVTNAPAGEHTFSPWAWDYAFNRARTTPVRVLVRAKGAPKVVLETPLTFEQARTLRDGTIRLKLSGGVGQICRLERSSDLINWELATKVYLPNGELEYVDRQPAVWRYFRLLKD